MRSLSLQPDDLLTIPGMALSIDFMRFVSSTQCNPSYRVLTFALVGLLPTGYISLLLDILFGSFLPNLWSSCNQSVRSREPTLLCNHQTKHLVISPTCFASRGPRVRVPPRPQPTSFQQNSFRVFSCVVPAVEAGGWAFGSRNLHQLISALL